MNVYDFEANTIDGRAMRLDAYRGKALLIVNVASHCGLTPQYAELEALYRKYRDQGFEVLGFPCNQFGGQEPGDEVQIQSFCTLNYQVSFPLFAKITVNGRSAHPLYQFLKSARRGLLGTKTIKWNFSKFLVDRQGNVAERYAPTVRANRIEEDLVPLLTAAVPTAVAAPPQASAR
jgi:glutathione peroxidase